MFSIKQDPDAPELSKSVNQLMEYPDMHQQTLASSIQSHNAPLQQGLVISAQQNTQQHQSRLEHPPHQRNIQQFEPGKSNDPFAPQIPQQMNSKDYPAFQSSPGSFLQQQMHQKAQGYSHNFQKRSFDSTAPNNQGFDIRSIEKSPWTQHPARVYQTPYPQIPQKSPLRGGEMHQGLSASHPSDGPQSPGKRSQGDGHHPVSAPALALAHRTRYAETIPHAPVSVVSSFPDYDSKKLNADDTILASKRMEQVIYSAIASPDICFACKISFGTENPHGAYHKAINQLSGPALKVEINNFGAIESRVYLPCGHELGNNCAVPYSFCPCCGANLHYPDCPHKIPQTTYRRNKLDSEKKCVGCRVLEYEHAENLSGLLAQVEKQKEFRSRCSEQLSDLQRDNVEYSIKILQKKISEIKAETDYMIEEARQKLFGNP